MKKKPKIITIICYILFLCSLALMFLTDAPTFIFAAVMSLLAAAISTTKKNNIPVLLLLAGGVGLIFPPLTIESRSVWKYPFQRFYTSIYMNIKEPDFFPDSFDNVQGDYRFSYMPSFGQATLQRRMFKNLRTLTRSRHVMIFHLKSICQGRHIM